MTGLYSSGMFVQRPQRGLVAAAPAGTMNLDARAPS
jgi:hypothetical protein